MTEREIYAAAQDIRDRHLTLAEGWAFCSSDRSAPASPEPDYELRICPTFAQAQALQQAFRKASPWEWPHTGPPSNKIVRLW